MSPSPFGLYAAPACAPGQKLGPGAALDLVTPVTSKGVTLFRRSLWLPIPASARHANALTLEPGNALALSFTPADIPINTGDNAWFSRVETSGNQTVRLDFTWPAPLRRINVPAGTANLGFDLFRVDGVQVAEDPSQSGTTGAALNPPWVGSPVQIKLSHPIFPHFKGDRAAPIKHKNAQARAATQASQPGTQPVAVVETLLDFVQQSNIIPTLTLAGTPTSPRLKLFLESPGPEVLLWQALVPGPTSTVTLPAQPVAEEWSAALEQVLKALQNTPSAPLARLRLDLESDTPCALTLQHATLALSARYALAPLPNRLDFDGGPRQTQTIDLGAPAGGTPTGLVIKGRLEGAHEPAPAGGGGSPLGRSGILLEPDQALVLRQSLSGAVTLAGLGILWHPLTEALRGHLSILADGGNRPGRTLLEEDFSLATAAPGWLALRWPSADFQPQTLWLKLTIEEGSGLWLAAADDVPATGWVETYRAGMPSPPPLACTPALQWLSASNPTQTQAGAPNFNLAGQNIPVLREDNTLLLVCPPAPLAAPELGPLAVSSAAPARFVLESAELSLRL